MKIKLLSFILFLAILTSILCSCEGLEFVNHMLNIFGPGDDSDTNIHIHFGEDHVHTVAINPAEESTCTTKGKTEGRYCTDCGVVLVPQNETPLKEHTLITIDAVAATCYSKGMTEGKKCSSCGTYIVQPKETYFAPHTYDDKYDADCNVCNYIRSNVECAHNNTVITEGYEATCTSSGLTNGSICKNCKEIIVEQQIIPVKDHIEVIDSAIAPTCQSIGLTEGRHCSECNTITKEQTVIPVLPHVESDWIIDRTPTIDSEGLKHTECTECHIVLEQQSIPMLSWVEKETKTNYYAEFPEGYSADSHLAPKYKNAKIENSVNGNTRIVVTETKVYSYIYWHWVDAEKSPYDRYIGSVYGQILGGSSSRKAIYFHEFETFDNYGHTDSTGKTEKSHVFFCDRANGVDCSWWWYQIPVYVQTYTIYELSE